jgi:hypothetical protein
MERRGVTVLKAIVAAAAVVALVAIPARRLAPNLTLAELVLCIAGALVGLILLAVCSLQLAQFVLRNGGTDPQWFWFRGEPPGLEELRGKNEEGRP